MRLFFRAVAVCFCFLIAIACAQTDAGFENFKRFNNGIVGKSIHERPSFARTRKPFSTVKLPNGNDENRYLLYNASLGRPPCIVIYEVNPKTEIVVRSSFEGDEKGCVIVP